MRSLTVLLLAAALVACNRGEEKDRESERPARAASTAKARPAIFSEPEAIGVMHAISDAEIAMAQTARDRSQNDEILAYARVMLADHGAFKRLISGAARDNAMSTAIRSAGDSIARGLTELTAGFNNTYIEEQVKAHQQALQLLDTAIVPSVRDTSVRNLLMQARPTIVAHLQRAMQILSKRRREATESGEPWVSGLPQVGDTGYISPEPSVPIPSEPRPSEPRPRPAPQPQRPDTTAPITTTSM